MKDTKQHSHSNRYPQFVMDNISKHYPAKDNTDIRRGLSSLIQPYSVLGGMVNFYGEYRCGDISCIVPIVTSHSGQLDFSLAEFWEDSLKKIFAGSDLIKSTLKSDEANASLSRLVQSAVGGGSFKGLKIMTLIPQIMSLRKKLQHTMKFNPVKLFDREGREVFEGDFDLAPSITLTFNSLDIQALLGDQQMINAIGSSSLLSGEKDISNHQQSDL